MILLLLVRLGGLTTAALLSKQGKKVLVLERHYTAGGFTHAYSRKGFEWDVGFITLVRFMTLELP